MRIIAQVFQFVSLIVKPQTVDGRRDGGKVAEASRSILWAVGGSLRVLEVGYGC